MRWIAYLWPFAQYRDASRGSALQRAAAWRHNRQLARQLPVYLHRWLAICCLLLTASVAAPPWLAPAAGTAFALAFCLTLHIAHVCLLFRRS